MTLFSLKGKWNQTGSDIIHLFPLEPYKRAVRILLECFLVKIRKGSSLLTGYACSKSGIPSIVSYTCDNCRTIQTTHQNIRGVNALIDQCTVNRALCRCATSNCFTNHATIQVLNGTGCCNINVTQNTSEYLYSKERYKTHVDPRFLQTKRNYIWAKVPKTLAKEELLFALHSEKNIILKAMRKPCGFMESCRVIRIFPFHWAQSLIKSHSKSDMVSFLTLQVFKRILKSLYPSDFNYVTKQIASLLSKVSRKP